MAVSPTFAGAFEAGAERGSEPRLLKQERKQAMWQLAQEQKAKDLGSERLALQQKYADSLDENGNPTDATKTINQQMVQNASAIREFYHPDNNPGAIEKFGHILTDALHITSPQKRAQEAEALKARQTMQDIESAHAAEAGSPLSPEEVASVKTRAAINDAMTAVEQSQKDFLKLNPKATPEAQHANLNLLMEKYFGIQGRGHWVNVTGTLNGKHTNLLLNTDTGDYRFQDLAPVPPDMLTTWKPEPVKAGSAVAQNLVDYRKAIEGGYKGSFAEWTATQSAKGRAAVPKPLTADQQAELLVKKQLEGTITPQESLELEAIKKWNYDKTTEPRIAGYQALMWARIVQVAIPGEPGETTYVPAGVAYKGRMHGVSSLSHLMAVYYGTGKGGQQLVAFNTATHHIQTMLQLASALHNGDNQTVNRMKNAWAAEFGNPAPTNFDGVRDALLGELVKLYTGVGATTEEIDSLKTSLSSAESFPQLEGIANTDTALMHGKIEASAYQYAMGSKGQPGFPVGTLTEAEHEAGIPTPSAPENIPPHPSSMPGGSYKHTASSPGKPMIGTNDDPNSPNARWFYVKTGKPVGE